MAVMLLSEVGPYTAKVGANSLARDVRWPQAVFL
jgi:hypothetical protein